MTVLRLILLTLFLPLAAQNPETFDQLHDRGIEAYRQKDYRQRLNCMQRAHKPKPNHIRTLYNLSLAYLLMDQADQAVTEMDRLARRGIVSGANTPKTICPGPKSGWEPSKF